jgi:acetate kinase
MGKRGPKASAARSNTNTNSAHLRKRLEKAAGHALSGLLGDVVVDLRAQVAAEQKRRKTAEKALRIVRSRLQKIIASVKE